MGEFLLITLLLFAGLLGALTAFGIILHYLEKKNMSMIVRTFGTAGVLATGLGTVIHELGHLIMCVIFRHKVLKVELLRPRKFKQDGVLGLVTHSYNKRSFYQTTGNFFIGAGPILVGIPIIALLMWLLVPSAFNSFIAAIGAGGSAGEMFLRGIPAFFTSLFSPKNLTKLGFWVFLMLYAVIILHMSLSTADLKGCGKGIGALSVIIVVVAAVLAALNTGAKFIAAYNIFIISFMLMGILLSLLMLLLLQIPYRIKRRLAARRLAKRYRAERSS